MAAKEKQVWCDNVKCTRAECVRHINTAPFGVVLTVSRFNKENKTVCKEFLEEWPAEPPKKRTRKKTGS